MSQNDYGEQATESAKRTEATTTKTGCSPPQTAGNFFARPSDPIIGIEVQSEIEVLKLKLLKLQATQFAQQKQGNLLHEITAGKAKLLKDEEDLKLKANQLQSEKQEFDRQNAETFRQVETQRISAEAVKNAHTASQLQESLNFEAKRQQERQNVEAEKSRLEELAKKTEKDREEVSQATAAVAEGKRLAEHQLLAANQQLLPEKQQLYDQKVAAEKAMEDFKFQMQQQLAQERNAAHEERQRERLKMASNQQGVSAQSRTPEERSQDLPPQSFPDSAQNDPKTIQLEQEIERLRLEKAQTDKAMKLLQLQTEEIKERSNTVENHQGVPPQSWTPEERSQDLTPQSFQNSVKNDLKTIGLEQENEKLRLGQAQIEKAMQLLQFQAEEAKAEANRRIQEKDFSAEARFKELEARMADRERDDQAKTSSKSRQIPKEKQEGKRIAINKFVRD